MLLLLYEVSFLAFPKICVLTFRLIILIYNHLYTSLFTIYSTFIAVILLAKYLLHDKVMKIIAFKCLLSFFQDLY